MIEGKRYSHTSVKFGPVDAGDKVTTTLAVTDSETGDITTYVVRTTVVAGAAALALPIGFRWTEGSMLPTKHAQLSITGAWDRLFADEHITWIRGWPEIDSPEVQALLVADALGPGAVPEHALNDGGSSDPRIYAYDYDERDFE